MQRQATTVLVIEDDRDLLDLMSEILESSGYAVIRAENGRVALASVAEQMPHVILLDMRMPVMNGWEFAREFRARHDRRAPIVVVTAAADAETRAEDIGADDWIGKPFDIQVLLAAVARLTAGNVLPVERPPDSSS